MSIVTGIVTQKKKGKTTKVAFSNRKKKTKLAPKKAAQFLKDFRRLLAKYGIPRT
jgi:hypothetical protein